MSYLVVTPDGGICGPDGGICGPYEHNITID